MMQFFDSNLLNHGKLESYEEAMKYLDKYGGAWNSRLRFNRLLLTLTLSSFLIKWIQSGIYFSKVQFFTVYRKKIEEQYAGLGKKYGLTDDLEAYILDLGDASRVSATISTNFNGVELIGLREMMVHRQYDKIDQYEKEWRKKHNIKDCYPSTLVESEIKSFEKNKKLSII